MKRIARISGNKITYLVYKVNNKKIEFIKLFESVVIIPLIEKDKVILVKQYRYPIRKFLYELPAGKVEKGESIYKAAKRELKEETGYDGRLKKIGSFYVSPGISNEIYHFFLATNLKKKSNYNFKEIKEVKIVNIEELKKYNDLKTAFAYFIIKEII